MTVQRQIAARTTAEKWRAKNGLPVEIGVSLAQLRRRKLDATLADTAALEAAAARHRATDPVECAVRILRQRGHAVHNSAVDGGPEGTWFVSGKGRIDAEAVIAFAATKSGGGDRIAAARVEEAAAMTVSAEQDRLRARGVAKARVLDDLARVKAAAGTWKLLGVRLRLDNSTLANFASGASPLSERLLTALYGDDGCTLRPELLVAPKPLAPPATTRAVPLARAAAEAARVEPEDEDQTVGDDDAADDIAQPEAPSDKLFDDVGDALERQASAKAALHDAVDALRDDEVSDGHSVLWSEQARSLAVARDVCIERLPMADDPPAAAPDPGILADTTIAGERTNVAFAPLVVRSGEIVAEPAGADMMRHASAPIASVIGHLDTARSRIIAAAARARAEIAAQLAALEAKADADLAALDRAAAIVAEVG